MDQAEGDEARQGPDQQKCEIIAHAKIAGATQESMIREKDQAGRSNSSSCSYSEEGFHLLRQLPLVPSRISSAHYYVPRKSDFFPLGKTAAGGDRVTAAASASSAIATPASCFQAEGSAPAAAASTAMVTLTATAATTIVSTPISQRSWSAPSTVDHTERSKGSERTATLHVPEQDCGRRQGFPSIINSSTCSAGVLEPSLARTAPRREGGSSSVSDHNSTRNPTSAQPMMTTMESVGLTAAATTISTEPALAAPVQPLSSSIASTLRPTCTAPPAGTSAATRSIPPKFNATAMPKTIATTVRTAAKASSMPPPTSMTWGACGPSGGSLPPCISTSGRQTTAEVPKMFTSPLSTSEHLPVSSLQLQFPADTATLLQESSAELKTSRSLVNESIVSSNADSAIALEFPSAASGELESSAERATPSAPWLVQEALSVKAAVEAAVQGIGLHERDKGNGMAAWTRSAEGGVGNGMRGAEGEGGGTERGGGLSRRHATAVPDEVIAKVPRLVADLHAALGRGVSTSEAKEWVRELDRLGEGLDGDTLLEACRDASRGGPPETALEKNDERLLFPAVIDCTAAAQSRSFTTATPCVPANSHADCSADAADTTSTATSTTVDGINPSSGSSLGGSDASFQFQEGRVVMKGQGEGEGVGSEEGGEVVAARVVHAEVSSSGEVNADRWCHTCSDSSINGENKEIDRIATAGETPAAGATVVGESGNAVVHGAASAADELSDEVASGGAGGGGSDGSRGGVDGDCCSENSTNALPLPSSSSLSGAVGLTTNQEEREGTSSPSASARALPPLSSPLLSPPSPPPPPQQQQEQPRQLQPQAPLQQPIPQPLPPASESQAPVGAGTTAAGTSDSVNLSPVAVADNAAAPTASASPLQAATSVASSPVDGDRHSNGKTVRRKRGRTSSAELLSPEAGVSGGAGAGAISWKSWGALGGGSINNSEDAGRGKRRNASKFPDDVIAKVPCLAADLNGTLGRYVSLEEVKGSVRLLHRCGEGFSRERLLDGCLDIMGESKWRSLTPRRHEPKKRRASVAAPCNIDSPADNPDTSDVACAAGQSVAVDGRRTGRWRRSDGGCTTRGMRRGGVCTSRRGEVGNGGEGGEPAREGDEEQQDGEQSAVGSVGVPAGVEVPHEESSSGNDDNNTPHSVRNCPETSRAATGTATEPRALQSYTEQGSSVVQPPPTILPSVLDTMNSNNNNNDTSSGAVQPADNSGDGIGSGGGRCDNDGGGGSEAVSVAASTAVAPPPPPHSPPTPATINTTPEKPAIAASLPSPGPKRNKARSAKEVIGVPRENAAAAAAAAAVEAVGENERGPIGVLAKEAGATPGSAGFGKRPAGTVTRNDMCREGGGAVSNEKRGAAGGCEGGRGGGDRTMAAGGRERERERTPKRARQACALIPDSVISKVPRLTLDLAAFLRCSVSAEEAKARCRELDRCGEGLSQQELCNACVTLMLQRKKAGNGDEGITEGSTNRSAVARERDTASEGGIGVKTRKKVTPSSCSTTTNAMATTAAAASALELEGGPKSSNSVRTAKRRQSVRVAGEEEGGEGPEQRGGEGEGDGRAKGVKKVGERVAKQQRRQGRRLIPDSVISKVPRLAVELETFVGYAVSVEEAKARCRELDRCGEGLTQQELCNACVCLLLTRDDRNLGASEPPSPIADAGAGVGTAASAGTAAASSILCPSPGYVGPQLPLCADAEDGSATATVAGGNDSVWGDLAGKGENREGVVVGEGHSDATLVDERKGYDKKGANSSSLIEGVHGKAVPADRSHATGDSARDGSGSGSGNGSDNNGSNDSNECPGPAGAADAAGATGAGAVATAVTATKKRPRLFLRLRLPSPKHPILPPPPSSRPSASLSSSLSTVPVAETAESSPDDDDGLIATAADNDDDDDEDGDEDGGDDDNDNSDDNDDDSDDDDSDGNDAGELLSSGDTESDDDHDCWESGADSDNGDGGAAGGSLGKEGKVLRGCGGGGDVSPNSPSAFTPSPRPTRNSSGRRREESGTSPTVQSLIYREENGGQYGRRGRRGSHERIVAGTPPREMSKRGRSNDNMDNCKITTTRQKFDGKTRNKKKENRSTRYSPRTKATAHPAHLQQQLLREQLKQEQQQLRWQRELKCEVGEFAVFLTPPNSPVPFLVGKILQKRQSTVSVPHTRSQGSNTLNRTEIVVHWYSPKMALGEHKSGGGGSAGGQDSDETGHATMPRDGSVDADDNVSRTGWVQRGTPRAESSFAPAAAAAAATAAAAAMAYGPGGWSGGFVPDRLTKRVRRDTGVENLAAAMVLFPRLLKSNGGIPTKVRSAVGKAVAAAVMAEADTAVPTNPREHSSETGPKYRPL